MDGVVHQDGQLLGTSLQLFISSAPKTKLPIFQVFTNIAVGISNLAIDL